MDRKQIGTPELGERIRRIKVCGGSTTCPVALHEEQVALVAGEMGLVLPDHSTKSMISEVLEAWIIDRAAAGTPYVSQGLARFLSEDDVVRLLEINGLDVPSQEGLTALTAEAEAWIRQQACRVQAAAGDDPVTPEQIRQTVLQGLSA